MKSALKSWFHPRVVYTAITIVLIVLGSFLAIRYAKGGYRFTDKGFANGTGLLSTNSFPTGAEVYIDGKLITATDDTLYLVPAEYQVEIKRDGYSPWQKKVQIEKELVVQTNARLFPIAPSLTPLTLTGLQNITPSPDGQRLVYYSASASASRKNGLYLYDLSSSPLPFSQGTKQISNDSNNFDLAEAEIIWSPDSSEIMVISGDRQVLLPVNKQSDLDTLPDIVFQRGQILSEWEQEMYLRERQYLSLFPAEIIEIATESAKNVYFSPDKKRLIYTATTDLTIPENIVPSLPATNTQPEERSIVAGGIYVYDRQEDKNFKVGNEEEITAIKELVWEEDADDEMDSEELSRGVAGGSVAGEAASGEVTSSRAAADKTVAGTAVTGEKPAVGSTVTDNVLSRTTRPGAKYLLTTDLDNPNSPLLTASASAFTRLQSNSLQNTINNFKIYHSPIYADTFQWYPDSNHLLYTKDSAIKVMEYDATNHTTIYSGPFDQSFLYPWPDGNRLLIKTSFSADTPANLYAIELK